MGDPLIVVISFNYYVLSYMKSRRPFRLGSWHHSQTGTNNQYDTPQPRHLVKKRIVITATHYSLESPKVSAPEIPKIPWK